MRTAHAVDVEKRGARYHGPEVERTGGRRDPWQASVVGSPEATEIHVRARPAPGAEGPEAAIESAYARLREALVAQGAAPSDVVAEKVFVSDARAQSPVVERVRKRFYAAGSGASSRAPASSIVQQPPLDPASPCEVKALALLTSEGRPLPIRRVVHLPDGTSGCVVAQGELRQIYLSGITGDPGDAPGAEGQAASMFARAQAVLLREGFSFDDVFRTWIYLPEIDRDYAALNHVRRAFFRTFGIHPSPASTGIQGTPAAPGRLCSMDLRAVTGLANGAVRSIHASTLNEAPSYGSDFSRGLRVEVGDRTWIHLSGTASIDERGAIVHEGSIDGQADRMLDNVERLLEGQGAGWDDLVTLTTYLKRADFVEPFLRAAERRGLPDEIPHTICLAGICRPGWLCEMEGLAVLV